MWTEYPRTDYSNGIQMPNPNRQGSSDKRLPGWQRKAVRERYLRAHPLCAECERQGRLAAATELDHVVPLSKGGTHDDANLQGLCRECHATKSRAERGLAPKGCDASGIPLDPNHHWNR